MLSARGGSEDSISYQHPSQSFQTAGIVAISAEYRLENQSQPHDTSEPCNIVVVETMNAGD